MARPRSPAGRLDDAARAGWLYYIAGKNQDEVAAAMGISRQAAQRLIALSVSEGLVRFWMDHPIARCLDLAKALTERFGLVRAEVVPSDPDADGGTTGLGEAGAAEIERWLRTDRPIVMAVGTGRTLKAAIDHLPPIHCPQNCVVSLTGNVGPDGTAAYYNVIFSMADAIEARHFPMPLPVFVASPEERALMHGQALIRSTLALAAAADVAFVGIGEMDDEAPLYLDRFLTRAELDAERAAGAVGEILRLDLRPRGPDFAGPRRRPHRERPDPRPRARHGHRARQGQPQAAGDRRRPARPTCQRPDHRRSHGRGPAHRFVRPATEAVDIARLLTHWADAREIS